ncbi:MAG: carbamoyl-phosphate synthase large subunit [Verrucomicrobiota bacterium]|nr:carbamoyl-phosphate synthase large subunit [Verrucomicrobiota bacterium]MDY5597433.1 carbamoyl-phosphate synthase large subunit [Kiritimatiellia bacterium]
MKRADVDKVLIIGSGPIVIGQACEFDYSGTQACKALRSCGYKVVLVNSNPATIMTDPLMADATYIEPLNEERLEQIIEKERPDAILPNLGGQTGLNLSMSLAKKGVLDKYGVKVIGVNLDAIERGEDREVFKETMARLGIETPCSGIVHSVDEAVALVHDKIGYPVVVRPAYTMGGAGGGFCYNVEELRTICARGLDASLTHQCLIEESILNWEELEVEVVRDAKNQMIAVCFIENIDAVGVHTGDSFCAAPFLTISEDLQERLRRDAFKIVEAIGVIGGTNVQFAHDPKTGRVVIIEINPRTSRSSALASKATGFPIALISAKLASGMTMDEIPYWRDGTLEKYTPSGDYVVLKFARWAFEKFRAVEDHLGTQMKAVGEVMSIGKTYKETLQKAIRALEKGRAGLGFAKDFHEKSLDELLKMLSTPNSERHFQMYEALRKGATDEQIFNLTGVKAYFVQQMRELVQEEEELLRYKGSLPPDELLVRAKKDGFSDKYIAQLLKVSEKEVRERRTALGCVETWHAVPVSGVENQAYYYSSYNGKPGEVPVSDNRKKVLILGGGPNRIGQGIEFDYCCTHAAMAMREAGYETIMVNCNPETVSTDYDTSDKLYFEPVTLEDVLQIYQAEKPEGVIVQFGGQTPLNIAAELEAAGCRILGTSVKSIDAAEDRDLFHSIMDRLGIPMPESRMASDLDGALKVVKEIGYPIVIRPSFVLGGRGMEVIYDETMLREYIAKAVGVTPDRPLYLDRFLHHALECEADALSDGKDIFIPAIMQHIELAGVHSGDSACVLPPVAISEEHKATILDYTRRIAGELKVVGLMNMQFAIEDDKVYVIEANPRASRTVPLVSKVAGTQMARIATRLMLGESVASLGLDRHKTIPYYGVKEAVLPFEKFPEVDPVLGPEMRSTGEVLGLAETFGLAYYKSQEAAGAPLPILSGKLLVSLSEKPDDAVMAAKNFADLGFEIVGTEGTVNFLREKGVPAKVVAKIGQGRPDVLDMIKNREIALILNTPSNRRDSRADDNSIRRAAIKYRIPYLTTIAAALAASEGIKAAREGKGEVRSLQSYHASIIG